MDFPPLDLSYKLQPGDYTENPWQSPQQRPQLNMGGGTGPMNDLSAGMRGMQPNWSNEDTKRQLEYTLRHIGDWGQTRNIARNPQKFHEINPLLGKHPSTGDVDKHFAREEIVGLLTAMGIDPKYRHLYQNSLSILEALLLHNNQKIGLKMDF